MSIHPILRDNRTTAKIIYRLRWINNQNRAELIFMQVR